MIYEKKLQNCYWFYVHLCNTKPKQCKFSISELGCNFLSLIMLFALPCSTLKHKFSYFYQGCGFWWILRGYDLWILLSFDLIKFTTYFLDNISVSRSHYVRPYLRTQKLRTLQQTMLNVEFNFIKASHYISHGRLFSLLTIKEPWKITVITKILSKVKNDVTQSWPGLEFIVYTKERYLAEGILKVA